MNTANNKISLLILAICGWVGWGTTALWGGEGMLFMLALGGLWIWGRRQFPWIGTLSFLCLIVVSIGGMVKHTQELVFLSGMIGALVVWDLERFVLRLQRYQHIENKLSLLRQHLLRLGTVLGLGLFLLMMAFKIELELEFWYAIPLIGLIIVGINSILRLTLKRD